MEGKKTLRKGIFLAVLAAALYSINSPFSKVLLSYMPPTLMAGFLYLGAGIGMLIIGLVRKMRESAVRENKIGKKDIGLYSFTCTPKDFLARQERVLIIRSRLLWEQRFL